MAQPQITTEQVQHLLNGAETHAKNGSYNQQLQAYQMGLALTSAILLVAQELDQIGDALAVLAKLKNPQDVSLT